MNVCLFYLVIWLFIIPVAGKGAIVIEGQLPANPHSLVTLYGYADYISKAPVEILKVHTNGAGNFRVTVTDSCGPLLKLLVENRSLSFFALPGGAYTIRDTTSQLAITDAAGVPVNQLLHNMEQELLKNWYSLFVDTTGNFRLTMPADTVFQRFHNIVLKYTGDTTSAAYPLLRYDAAGYYLAFIRQLPDTIGLMDHFENDYFNSPPIQERNPFYMELLGNDMMIRILYLAHQRYKGNPGQLIDKVTHEAAYFKSPQLQQLALVAGCNQAYRISREPELKDELSRRIHTTIPDSLSNLRIRNMLSRVISENTRARIGNKFPLLTLKNEKNETVNFGDIKSDLILVDFWATWCWGCVEGMKSFPAWISQCNGKLTIVTVSVDDNLQAMKAFLDKRERVPGVLSLYNGRTGGYPDKLQLTGYPTYILLNKKREIIAMPGYTSAVAEQLKAALH
ncbi:Thiol-disulfide isomerase or thioredoxin [Chitinophaga ginsengisegetis]|uniref:Thiol-disulfide isomerase or thioredoxin n=1 Tax=Chitinophaga ginsengisegetis TaxID=393003 RepID=A0A1T5NDI8_9BACT|nr:TlpA disulfide reductase family protein [Chitinophaga ginsengisegetis]SKC98464.1 Thiol-disulfide isomerase or thioredoxin [Chitinophaga ginsengisegetis]